MMNVIAYFKKNDERNSTSVWLDVKEKWTWGSISITM